MRLGGCIHEPNTIHTCRVQLPLLTVINRMSGHPLVVNLMQEATRSLV